MKEFLIRIRTLFGRQGADEASKALDETGQSATRAGGDIDEAAEASRNLNLAAGQAADSLDRTAHSARDAGQATREASAQANPGPFRRFFDGIRDGANRSVTAMNGLLRATRGLLALAGIGGVGMMTRSMMNLAESIERNAQVTGLTTREWQRLEFAATQNKASADDLREALHQLNLRAMQNAEAFEKWGISTRDANGEQRESIAILRDIADRMQNAATAGERAALANETMERTGRRLIPLLQQGGKALDEWGDKAEQAGQVMDDQTIRRLNDAKDAWAAFGTQVTITSGEVLMGINDLNKALQGRGLEPEQQAAIDARKQAEDDIVAIYEKQMDGIARTMGMTTRGLILSQKRAEIEARTNAILNEQTEERLRQQRLNEEAAAEAARLAAIEADLAEDAKQRARQAEIHAMFADAEAEAMYQQLSDAEKLLEIERRIAEVRDAALLEADIEAAQTLLVLEREREEVVRSIAEAKERAADAAERETERRRSAVETLVEDYRIMQARAAGQNELADKLAREARVRREVRRIVEETGLEEAQVEAFVRRRLEYERQIADQKKRQTDETKRQQSEEERLMEIARGDLEGRTAAGRDARRTLVERGVLSRNAAEATRQLTSGGGPSPQGPSPSFQGNQVNHGLPGSVAKAPDTSALTAGIARSARSEEQLFAAYESSIQAVLTALESKDSVQASIVRRLERLETTVKRNR